MNRENAVEDYAVSLDIGNASVGWAAFTPNYRLMRAKGHELIGARLFACFNGGGAQNGANHS